MCIRDRYDVPLCKYQGRFNEPVGWPSIIYYGLSLLTVLESLLARSAIACLTNLTSFKTETARVRFMTVSIFMILFFNYGIMYLFAPLDFNTDFMKRILSGIYTDFGNHWFLEIGSLIVTNQLIIALMPPVVLLLNWLWSAMLHKYDQRRCRALKEPESTRTKTLLAF